MSDQRLFTQLFKVAKNRKVLILCVFIALTYVTLIPHGYILISLWMADNSTYCVIERYVSLNTTTQEI